jgi:hypothetical protein
MGTVPHLPTHDCLRFPAVRDPEWVEASFGHS